MSTQKFTPSINEPKSTPESESTPPCILDPLDDRIVERVDVVPFEGETVLHRVQGYEIIFHDRDGVEICRRIEAVEDSAVQDVVDYLPYHGTRIGFTESLRPALATRPLLGCSPEISVPASGIAVGTAGGYLRDENNEHGIADSADRVRRTKLADVTPVGMVEVLRGAASPLPNASTELIYFRCQEVEAPPQDVMVTYGDTFEGVRIIRFAESSEILTRYLEGADHDIRLGEAAWAFIEKKGVPYHLPESVRLMLPEHCSISPLPTALRALVIDTEGLRDLIRNPDYRPGKIGSWELQEVALPNDCPVSSNRFLAQNVKKSGETTRPYIVETVSHRGLDRLSSGAFLTADGEPYLVITVGTRTALFVRGRTHHQIQTKFSPWGVEGVSCLVNDAVTREDLDARLNASVTRYSGMSPKHPPRHLQASFLSPGFNPAAVDQYLTEMDPATFDPQSLTDPLVDTFLIKVSDILPLLDDGTVRDLPLATTARILKAAFDIHPAHRSIDATDEETAELTRILDSAASLSEFASSLNYDHYKGLEARPEFLEKFLFFSNNRALHFRDEPIPGRETFFQALIPEVNRQSVLTPEELFDLDFIHDAGFHFGWGDLVPVPGSGSEGPKQVMSFEEYFEAQMKVESKALLFSEVEYAEKIGFDVWRARRNGLPSIGEMLACAGYTDSDSKLHAIEEMAVRGRIPYEISSMPNFDEFRPLVETLLVGFYIRDRRNLRLHYDAWVEHPEVAVAMAKFCKGAWTDIASFLRGPRREDSQVDSYGFNRLRYRLCLERDIGIVRKVCDLAYLISLAGKNGVIETDQWTCSAREYMELLSQSSSSLDEAIEGVVDSDLSGPNYAALRALRGAEAAVAKAGIFIEASLDRGLPLPEGTLRDFVPDCYRFFPDIRYFLTEEQRNEATAMVSELIERSR